MNNTNNVISTIKDNRPITGNVVQPAKNLQTEDTNFPLKNNNVIHSSFNQLGLLPGKQTLESALDAIIANGNDDQYIALAKLYRKSSKGINVIITDLTEAGVEFASVSGSAGVYRTSNNTVYLNTSNPDNTSPQEVVRVLLHEATHALTNEAIDKFYNNSPDLSSSARKAISGINEFNTVRRLPRPL